MYQSECRPGRQAHQLLVAVAVFRPVEMVVLRPTDGDRLHYAQCATAFDPLPDDHEAMGNLAHRVGAALREAVGTGGRSGSTGFSRRRLLPHGTERESRRRHGAATGPSRPTAHTVVPGSHRGRTTRLQECSEGARRHHVFNPDDQTDETRLTDMREEYRES